MLHPSVAFARDWFLALLVGILHHTLALSAMESADKDQRLRLLIACFMSACVFIMAYQEKNAYAATLSSNAGLALIIGSMFKAHLAGPTMLAYVMLGGVLNWAYYHVLHDASDKADIIQNLINLRKARDVRIRRETDDRDQGERADGPGARREPD